MLLSFLVFLGLVLLGMPVVFAIGIGGLVYFLTQPELQLTMRRPKTFPFWPSLPLSWPATS